MTVLALIHDRHTAATACLIASIAILRGPAVLAGPLQSDAVQALLAAADRASFALRFDEAEARLDEALTLAEQARDATGLARAQRLKCSVYSRMGRPTDARVWCQRALDSFEALGDRHGIASALLGLTAAAAQTGQRARARELGERALLLARDLGDDHVRARLLLNLISIEEAGDKRELLAGEALELGTRLGVDSIRGDALISLANERFSRSDLQRARARYEEALPVLVRAGDTGAVAAAYVSLGRVLRAHGDYEGALRRYREAINLLTPTRERHTLVEAWNASATALSYLGRSDEAFAATERGLTLARESGNQRLIDFMEGNLAGALMDKRAFDRAIPLLESVIARKPDPYIAAFRYNQLAVSLAEVGRAVEAKPLADEAVRLTRERGQVDLLERRLDVRAWILAKLGQLEAALADSREAMAIVEGVRSRLVPVDFLKRGYAERSAAIHLRGVDLLSRLDRPGEALVFAEQGRTRAFLDLLAARDTPDGTLPTRGGADTARAAPALASGAMGEPLDLSGIERVAQRLQSTILAFSVIDDATMLWVVPPGAATVQTRVPISRERLASLVAATTAPLRQSGSAPTRGSDEAIALPMRGLGLAALRRDDRSAWRELYHLLIEPVKSQLPPAGGRLTIVPHGPLFQLAFAALEDAGGRYLIEDYDLHYAPSISALEFTGRRQAVVAANANGPWTIVGNPGRLPLVGNRPLPPLPGAAREIAAVAALAPHRRAQRLEGLGAEEASLTRTLEASSPAVLHFATHGLVPGDPTEAPFLALHRSGTTTNSDGRLTVDDVYGLRLETKLVVLSACRSGAGQVSSDGVIGMTRAFFYAGAPSVVATFWDVTDDATTRLMASFYREYVKTDRKSASLRSAQLALLRDLRAGRVAVTAAGRRVTLPEHPLLWAAFFLSGEP